MFLAAPRGLDSILKLVSLALGTRRNGMFYQVPTPEPVAEAENGQGLNKPMSTLLTVILIATFCCLPVSMCIGYVLCDSAGGGMEARCSFARYGARQPPHTASISSVCCPFVVLPPLA